MWRCRTRASSWCFYGAAHHRALPRFSNGIKQIHWMEGFHSMTLTTIKLKYIHHHTILLVSIYLRHDINCYQQSDKWDIMIKWVSQHREQLSYAHDINCYQQSDKWDIMIYNEWVSTENKWVMLLSLGNKDDSESQPFNGLVITHSNFSQHLRVDVLFAIAYMCQRTRE